MSCAKGQDPLQLTAKIEDAPWWAKDVGAVLQPQTRQMLEEYAGIPPDQQIDRIERTRKQAWDLVPYPSIGALTWLNPYITLHEAHDTILAQVKAGATIIDCGCFIAPDLRYLASRGAPTKKMHGFDIESRFFDLGFDFYNDRHRWAGSFLAADGTKRLEATALAPLVGGVDIIWCPKYLHIYDRAHQVEVASNLVRLLKPQAGSIFAGSQNGLPVPEEMRLAARGFHGQQESFFLGNAETMREMWGEVAARTSTKWEVDARLLDLRTIGLHEDDGAGYKKKVGYNLQWTATLIDCPSRI